MNEQPPGGETRLFYFWDGEAKSTISFMVVVKKVFYFKFHVKDEINYYPVARDRVQFVV